MEWKVLVFPSAICSRRIWQSAGYDVEGNQWLHAIHAERSGRNENHGRMEL